MAFHAIPNGGNIFAPMHLPVFITGFLCGPMYGAIVGLVCPLMSCLFTGMPSVAFLPNMMAELLVYGTVTGLLFRIIKTGKIIPDAILTLILSMLAGRIVGGFVAYLLFLGGTRSEYSWAIFFTGYFVTCWPAIVIQILLIPTVVTLAKNTALSVKATDISTFRITAKTLQSKSNFSTVLPKIGERNPLLTKRQSALFFRK